MSDKLQSQPQNGMMPAAPGATNNIGSIDTFVANANQVQNNYIFGATVEEVVEIKKVWQTNRHTVCEGTLQIIRDSGAIDLIPVLFNDIIAGFLM